MSARAAAATARRGFWKPRNGRLVITMSVITASAVIVAAGFERSPTANDELAFKRPRLSKTF